MSILTACGNGLEFVKLKDAQFDATTSYAEGPNEVAKVQSRIDHMPSMGQVNNTKGRGIYLSIYYSRTPLFRSPKGNEKKFRNSGASK